MFELYVCKKSSRRLSYFVSAIFCCVFFVGVGMAILPLAGNYYGYCAAEEGDRYKLSNEQRLNIAIEDYIKGGSEGGYVEILRKEEFSDEDLRDRFAILPYRTREEFKDINPGCCGLVYGVPDGKIIGFWQRVQGLGDGMFHFVHRVRYKDARGVIKELQSKGTYYFVDNCGVSRSAFYY